MFSWKFCKNFKSTFFIEHLRATASDLSVQMIESKMATINSAFAFYCMVQERIFREVKTLTIRKFFKKMTFQLKF